MNDERVAAEAKCGGEPFAPALRAPPAKWRAFGASVVGATHIQRGIPNQDAVHWFPADDGLDKTGLPTIIAVSDGHGEAACVRSHHGARFAVEIAVESLRDFARDDQFRGSRGFADLKQYAPKLLSRRISEQWTTRVLEHSQDVPFTATELLQMQGPNDGPSDGRETKKRLKAYGCTLLAALVTPSFLIGLQVGDGALVIAYQDGRSSLLIPPHESHFGNDTTSLCSVPVQMQVEVRSLEGDAPAFVMACTDGYEKAIDTTYFQNELIGEYLEYCRVRDGWRKVYGELPAILEHATTKGSGDDATAAFLVSSLLETVQTSESSPVEELVSDVAGSTSFEGRGSVQGSADEAKLMTQPNGGFEGQPQSQGCRKPAQY
jgi:hypothetical protein